MRRLAAFWRHFGGILAVCAVVQGGTTEHRIACFERVFFAREELSWQASVAPWQRSREPRRNQPSRHRALAARRADRDRLPRWRCVLLVRDRCANLP
jgi:hypothetical protein